MIDVKGNDLWRGGQKIGYVQGNDIFLHTGQKVGYVAGNHVYDAKNNQPLAYLKGDFIHDARGNEQMKIEDNHQHVVGGELSDTHRAAIQMLLGD